MRHVTNFLFCLLLLVGLLVAEAQQFNLVNTGTGPDTGSGDSLRAAFGKINDSLMWITNNVHNSGMLANKLVWVSAATGNNITAQLYNPSKPYATIEAANAYATYNDTIVVMPGTYTTSAGYEFGGVNFYLMPGAVLQYTGSPGGSLFHYTDPELPGNGGGIGGAGTLYGDIHIYTSKSNTVVSIDAKHIAGNIAVDAVLLPVTGCSTYVYNATITGTNRMDCYVELHNIKSTVTNGYWLTTNTGPAVIWFLNDCRAACAPAATTYITNRGTLIIE